MCTGAVWWGLVVCPRQLPVTAPPPPPRHPPRAPLSDETEVRYLSHSSCSLWAVYRYAALGRGADGEVVVVVVVVVSASHHFGHGSCVFVCVCVLPVSPFPRPVLTPTPQVACKDALAASVPVLVQQAAVRAPPGRRVSGTLFSFLRLGCLLVCVGSCAPRRHAPLPSALRLVQTITCA